MNSVYIRLALYALLPVLGSAAASLATVLDGVAYNPATHTVSIGLEQLVAGVVGLVFGGLGNLAVFKKFGTK